VDKLEADWESAELGVSALERAGKGLRRQDEPARGVICSSRGKRVRTGSFGVRH
jgi:hypothetical protein